MSKVYIPITPKEFKKQMEEINEWDYTEDRHIYADKLMCDVLIQHGYSEGVEVFRKMELWYS